MSNMEKPKNREKRKRPSLKLGVFIATWWLLLIPVCAVTIWFGIWFMQPVSGHRVPVPHGAENLPQRLYPIAEALLDTVPIDEDIPVTDNVSLKLSYFEYFGSYMICIEGNGISEGMEYQNHSRILINSSHVQRKSTTSYGINLFARPYSRCVLANLEPGLHLIEFHLRDSRFGAPIAIQQWAIEIP